MPVYQSRYQRWHGKLHGRVYSIFIIALWTFRTTVLTPFTLVVLILSIFFSGVITVLSLLTSGVPMNREMFIYLFASGYIGSVILSASSIASSISPDLRNSVISLYFARPITKYDYLVGKGISAIATSSILTVLQPLLVVIVGILMYDGEWTLKWIWIRYFIGIMLSGILLALLFASASLAISGLTGDKKWPPAG
ncbi:MAG: hypothetical protein QW728_04430, partial [Thermoplasmata archaeon]